MELIDFRGLNCYQNALISIAAHYGINYTAAFAGLWGETEYEYNSRHEVYFTGMLLKNLAVLGVKSNSMTCDSPEKKEKILMEIPTGEPFLFGADAFFLPWSTNFSAVHDSHYFIAQKAEPGSFFCFDPTYNKDSIKIESSVLLPSVFEICRISIEKESPRSIVHRDAAAVVSGHSATKGKILEKLHSCAGELRGNALCLAKYVDTMINNRYLYKRYLEKMPEISGRYPRFFSEEYFRRWAAVKNGLYKVFVSKHNEGVIHEVAEAFAGLMEEEVIFAKEMDAFQQHRQILPCADKG